MISRRALFALGVGAIALPAGRVRAVQADLPLWPGDPPGGGGPQGPTLVSGRGAVSNVARPTLTVVAPHQPSGAAMLVAAGGGYRRIAIAEEAMPAAHWLTARGITAFVLTYRLPGEGWIEGPFAPLQDAQRAMRLIRAGIAGHPAPTRVGALGFSAGGHLLGLASARSAFRSYAPVDPADALSARPDTAALIYPVITLQAPYDGTSTRKALVGSHPDVAASAEWSVETHVRPGCPPMFLVQADDDPISDPANTRIMADACHRAGVPVERHELASGGHGFGLGRPGTPAAAWPGWYEAWLRHQGSAT